MSQNLVETAKQGDVRAIAGLMNRSLQPKGITAKVALRDGCLKVILEADPVPDPRLADYVHRGIANLDVASIQRLAVFGRQVGDEFPSWNQEFDLNFFDQLATPAPLVEAPQASSHELHCPKCHSTQVMVSKKGFGVGKAAAGVLLLGPIGLAGGMIGSNQAMLSCLKCGHQWQPSETSQAAPKVVSTTRWTPARIKVPSVLDRIGNAIFSFFGLGILGLVLFIIPIIGWFFGIICWLAAIGCPLVFLFASKEELKMWEGKCPHCHKDLSVQFGRNDGKCFQCQGEVVIKDQRFYGVEK